MFHQSVQKSTDDLITKIDQKIPIATCIADMNIVTKVNFEPNYIKMPPSHKRSKLEIGTRCICKTCLVYLKRGKLPPSSVMNGLQLHDTDAQLKEQGLWLTELEGSLIAPNLLFEKIRLLPKSRWTGLQGQIVNVPVSDDSINHTIMQLPRTPAGAGHIPIQIELKRKKDMVNNHKKQLINAEKVFRMLQKLKDCGSPYHQNISTPEEYKKRCRSEDEGGFDEMYGDQVDNLEEDVERMLMETEDELWDEIMGEKKEDENEVDPFDNEDPVKKYHFIYDESLCMMNKYPEIVVAPGEGFRPKGILGDMNWDVKAFPHLHNADGSNGKDQVSSKQ